MLYRIVLRSKCDHSRSRAESPVAVSRIVWVAKSGFVFRSTAGQGGRAAGTGALQSVLQVGMGNGMTPINPLGGISYDR